MNRLLTLATLIAAAGALGACTKEEQRHVNAIFTALDVSPAVLAAPADAVEPEPVVVHAAVVSPPPPPPPQYGEPGYVPAYGEKGYTGPEPCPGSVFRVLTCDDNGQDWHWLGPNMEWLD